MKTTLRVMTAGSLLLGLTVAWWGAQGIAQEAATDAARDVQVGDDESGRLPPGYSAVVTRKQRTRIYEIQDGYQKQLDELNKRIAELMSKRDAEIAQVLDDEQKRIVAYILQLRERERRDETAATTAAK